MIVCGGTVCIWKGERVKVVGTFKTVEGIYALIVDPKTNASLGNYPVSELESIR